MPNEPQCPTCHRPLEQLFEIGGWTKGMPTNEYRCKHCKTVGQTARFTITNGSLS